MSKGTILGTSVIADRWRVSLIKAVREEFERGDSPVEVGDRLVYREVDGQIVIEVA